MARVKNSTYPHVSAWDDVYFNTDYGQQLVADHVAGLTWDELRAPAASGSSGSSGGSPYDLMFFAGDTVSNSENLAIALVTRPFTIPATFTGSLARCETAPADSPSTATFILKKNGNAFGNVTWGTGEFAGTFSHTSSPAADISFVAGDRLEWEAPATADGTQADIYISIKATRTGS